MAALAVLSACDNWNIPVKDRMEFYASVVPVSSWAELQDLAENSDHAVLALTHDITVPNVPTSTIEVTRTLTITAFEGTRTISRGRDTATAFKFQLFEVGGGGNLTLGHPQGGTLILDGGAVWDRTGSTPVNIGVEAGIALVYVQGARLTIRDGAILRNNDNTTGDGGGVYVNSTPSAALIMTGGAISGNRAAGGGGGVYVNSSYSTEMTMTGGAISGNVASNEGGGVYIYSAIGSSTELTMTGGSISENTAFRKGGGVYVEGDGGNANLTMSGGVISWNEADSPGGGVCLDGEGGSTNLTMSGGVISWNGANDHGGGVHIYSSSGSAELTMTGGLISRNYTTIGGGGGVYVEGDGGNANLTMSGGSISENTAANTGGGVRIDSSSGSAELTMTGGLISGNEATRGGGGVYVEGDGGSANLTMSGGAISRNTAANNYDGGGVRVEGNGVFTMNGGIISGNISSDCGGGVYVNGTAVFKKEPEGLATTSGVIYGGTGLDPAPKNTASSDGKGHAVYIESVPKYRDTTVPESLELKSDNTNGWNE